MYSFPNLEPVCCSMSGSNCCFLTCIQISQEAGKVVWYFHLLKNFPQFIVIYTVKGFGVINKPGGGVFLEEAMATHSSVLAWRIPGMGEPGGLPSMGSHRVGHNWCDLAAAATAGVFLEFSCIFDDPKDVGNLISGSSAFSKSNLNIWKFMVHLLLKPGLENFEHYFASMWNECNCVVSWTFFDVMLLWDWNENWLFPVLWPLLSFPNLLAYWVSM